MKKIIKFIIALIVLAVLMFTEYRFIMCNLRPYNGDDHTIYIEFFGQVDEYDTLVPIKNVEE